MSDGLYALDNMSRRLHNEPGKDIYSCDRCSAMIVVPNGHTALDEDTELLCYDCDKPIGQKVYEALIR